MQRIHRRYQSLSVAVTNAIGTTPAIDRQDFAGVAVENPTGSSLTSFEIHGSVDGTNYVRLQLSGSDYTLTLGAGKGAVIDAGATFGFGWLKLVCAGAASGTIRVGMHG